MRHTYIFLIVLSFFSCVSTTKANEDISVGKEPEKPVNLAKITFFNYSIEDVYLRLMKRGNSAENIGNINKDEFGRSKNTDSLIPAGKSREYIIEADRYTIILKKDQYGRHDAAFNVYDEFYFPSSEEGYIIHLYPQHEKHTTVRITSNNIHEGFSDSLLPSFDVFFDNDMIYPIVENSVKLSIDGDEKLVEIEKQWHNRKYTIRPKEFLRPSTLYSVIVSLEARNTEGEQIVQADKYSFATKNLVEQTTLSCFDSKTIRFDISNPEVVRIEWKLPSEAIGSEIHISTDNKPEEIIDLQSKTNYFFLSEQIESINYKIVPYVIIDGEKGYNQTDIECLYMKIPYSVLYGVTHNIITNSVDKLEIRFIFNGIREMPDNLELILNNNDGEMFVLSTENTFTYKTNNPSIIPNKDVVYNLMIYDEDYSFRVHRPSDEEFYAFFEKKVLEDMETTLQNLRGIDKTTFTMSGELAKDSIRFEEKRKLIGNIYNKYSNYTYPRSHSITEYKKKVQTNTVFSEIESLYSELYNFLIENLIVSIGSKYNTTADKIKYTKIFLDARIKTFETYENWLDIKNKKSVKAAIDRVDKKYNHHISKKNK